MPRIITIPSTTYLQTLRECIAVTQASVDQLKKRLYNIEHKELPNTIARRTQLSEILRQRHDGDHDVLVEEWKKLAGVIKQLGKERSCDGERLKVTLVLLDTLGLELEIGEANVEVRSWLR